jgi:hypothetical protein
MVPETISRYRKAMENYYPNDSKGMILAEQFSGIE